MQKYRMYSNVIGIKCNAIGLRAGVALCLVVTTVSCERDNKPPAPAPPAQPVVQQPYIAGLESHKSGMAALAAKDTQEALRLLRKATVENRELAEAWYELGHLQVTLAPELSKTQEYPALAMFRDGLEMEQEALRLLDAGKVTFWTDEEQTTARTVMDADLLGADEALADPTVLAETLRLRVR